MSEELLPRIKVTEDGLIRVSIKDEFADLTINLTNSLIDRLTTAKGDAKDIIKLNKKKTSVLKNYNTIGRTIEPQK